MAALDPIDYLLTCKSLVAQQAPEGVVHQLIPPYQKEAKPAAMAAPQHHQTANALAPISLTSEWHGPATDGISTAAIVYPDGLARG